MGAIRQECKKLEELLDYWRKIAWSAAVPSRADFDPVDVPQLLGNIFLVDVERRPMRFRMRLAGSEIDRIFGRSYTGRYLDDIYSGYFEREALTDYARVVFFKQPDFTGRCAAAADGRWVRYQRLLLPLSADGWQVDMLLGGLDVIEIESALAAPEACYAG